MLFSKYHKSELAENAGNELGLKQCFEKMIQMQIIIQLFPHLSYSQQTDSINTISFWYFQFFSSSFFFFLLSHPPPPIFQQVIMHLIRSPCFLTIVTCKQFSFRFMFWHHIAFCCDLGACILESYLTEFQDSSGR